MRRLSKSFPFGKLHSEMPIAIIISAFQDGLHIKAAIFFVFFFANNAVNWEFIEGGREKVLQKLKLLCYNLN